MEAFALHHVPTVALLGLFGRDEIERHESKQSVTVQSSLEARKALLNALQAHGNISLYDSANQKKKFTVMNLEKTHVFTSQKKPSNIKSPSAGTALASFSPLSPLNSHSLLFPDGIMTPRWINKHREELPSVILSFHELWEAPQSTSNTKDPLSIQNTSSHDREHDQQLAVEINEKRKNAQDCGLKFAAVIILKTNKTDDPVIEERITFIRRSSMLDRNHQFVFCSLKDNKEPAEPAAFDELVLKIVAEFSSSYYREHEKRVKRKRAKASSLIRQPQTLVSVSTVKPLSLQGWYARYDIKLGVFCEFRQDFEPAIKHYESAYTGLLSILQNSSSRNSLHEEQEAIIDPKSARWSEARGLLDTICLKLLKLMTASGHHVNALIHLHKHFTRCKYFPEFVSNNEYDHPTTEIQHELCGIHHLRNVHGGGSPVYWEWASAQYREVGEIVEMLVSKTKLSLPHPPPGSAATQSQSILHAVSNTGINLMAGESSATAFSPFSSVNPLLTLQHAGIYYLLAARCTEERWRAFKRFSTNNPGILDYGQPNVSTDDHSVEFCAVIVELLTRSYENFKKLKASRMSLYIASEIARIYEQNGKFDMALKFFIRIAKTYRKEGWFLMLADINRRMIRCAKELRLNETLLECMIELLNEKLVPDDVARHKAFDSFLEVIHSGLFADSHPEVTEFDVDMDQVLSFLQCSVQFRTDYSHVQEPIHYQICIQSTARNPDLKVERIVVRFSNPQFNMCLLSQKGHSTTSSASNILIPVREAVKQTVPEEKGSTMLVQHADIDIVSGKSKTYAGTLVATQNQELQIESVSIVLASSPIRVALIFKIGVREAGSSRRRWLSLDNVGRADASDSIPRYINLNGVGEYSVIRIDQRKPKLAFKFEFTTPIYLDEDVPVIVNIQSDESEAMHVYFELRRDSPTEHPENMIHVFASRNEAEADSRAIIPGVASIPSKSHLDLGTVQPKSTTTRQFFVRAALKAGVRPISGTIYAFMLSSPVSVPQLSNGDYDLSNTSLLSKKLEDNVQLSFEKPFDTVFDVIPQAVTALSVQSNAGVFGVFDNIPDPVRLNEWIINASIHMNGCWAIELDAIRLSCPKVNNLKTHQVKHNISEKKWKKGHIESTSFITNASIDALASATKIDIGFLEIRWRRLEPSLGDWVHSYVELPTVESPAEILRIHADIPGELSVGTPVEVRYIFQNTTLHLAELFAFVESSETFVFSGYKQTYFRVLPLSTHVLQFICVPLTSGRCALPHLKVLKKTDIAALSAEGGSAAINDKLFPVSASKVHTNWSKNGELYVFVRPSPGW